MNTLHICPPHQTDVATLPWEIQKKVLFNITIHILQRKTNSSCCTAALAVYLLCLMLPIICIALVLRLGHVTGEAHLLTRTCWGLRQRLVATWAEFFSTAWCIMQLISFEKDWKHVLTQKVITLNTCCDVACLTFQLPNITAGSFQSLKRLKECNNTSVRGKSFAIHKLVWWHFQMGCSSGLHFVFFWDKGQAAGYQPRPQAGG